MDESSRIGVQAVTWDNLGEGWRMWCVCGEYVTIPCRSLVDAAMEIEDHWTDEHGGNP